MNVIRFSDLCAQGAVRGQRVLIRSDLNVPLDAHGQIREDTRVRASLGAIQMALQAGAAAVLVTSHLGRPKEGALQPGESLAPVAQRLAELLGRDVPLQKNWLAGNIPTPASGVLLLENCRGNPGEKANDAQLAQQLAQMCDIFVHDAFGTAHRMEASTHGVAQYARLACAGPLLCAEIDAITRALARPARPLVAIVGGSKVSTKLDVLLSLAQKVDRLIVGGGIANTFLLAAGHHIGKSLAEPGMLDQARAVMEAMAARGAEVPLPQDVVLAKTFAPDAAARSSSVDAVQADEMILDIGPKTAAQLAEILGGAQTIVWNGPVGVFEYPAFGQGTETLARAIATSPAFSLAGGGDTLAAIAQYNIADRIGYISTGGGAFLEMLEGKTLPALDILQRRAQDSVKNI